MSLRSTISPYDLIHGFSVGAVILPSLTPPSDLAKAGAPLDFSAEVSCSSASCDVSIRQNQRSSISEEQDGHSFAILCTSCL